MLFEEKKIVFIVYLPFDTTLKNEIYFMFIMLKQRMNNFFDKKVSGTGSCGKCATLPCAYHYDAPRTKIHFLRKLG